MCNFNNLDQKKKEFLHLFLTDAAKNIGGVNYLLALIEAMRAKKPHSLMQKNCQIASNNTIIKWNKVVFKDKVDLIQNILVAHREAEEKNFNILHGANSKVKKNIINMSRALAPLKFVITPQNPNDGEGFSFTVFETLEDDVIIFNPIFIALFFCSTEFTKKAIKYQI
ncbi:hypothetical protein FJR45_11840 [Sulfurimonas sediminis]|uniref:Uncharacterized protein n=1 Tax=Sulfurimonas sediminis TaxID=2590020 RepID=A0A7M1B4E8_9BACT|nr:hypothetical protein [Sulfurimonas sediminis]QOP44594.1 hypothetical protein FJR45_11840 [Sulfurimonas sediminis]